MEAEIFDKGEHSEILPANVFDNSLSMLQRLASDNVFMSNTRFIQFYLFLSMFLTESQYRLCT